MKVVDMKPLGNSGQESNGRNCFCCDLLPDKVSVVALSEMGESVSHGFSNIQIICFKK